MPSVGGHHRRSFATFATSVLPFRLPMAEDEVFAAAGAIAFAPGSSVPVEGRIDRIKP